MHTHILGGGYGRMGGFRVYESLGLREEGRQGPRHRHRHMHRHRHRHRCIQRHRRRHIHSHRQRHRCALVCEHRHVHRHRHMHRYTYAHALFPAWLESTSKLLAGDAAP